MGFGVPLIFLSKVRGAKFFSTLIYGGLREALLFTGWGGAAAGGGGGEKFWTRREGGAKNFRIDLFFLNPEIQCFLVFLWILGRK